MTLNFVPQTDIHTIERHKLYVAIVHHLNDFVEQHSIYTFHFRHKLPPNKKEEDKLILEFTHSPNICTPTRTHLRNSIYIWMI